MRFRKNTGAIAGYFAVLAGLGLIAASVGPTLPGLAAAAGVSLAQIGFLIFARSFGEMFGCLLTGRLIDQGYGGPTLALSVLIMAGCLASVPFLHSLILLTGIFLVFGAAQGAMHTGSNTLLVWKYPDRAHSLLSILHFSFGAGMVVAPLLVVWFLPFQPDGLFIYWVLAITLLPVALVLAVSSHPSVPPMEKATQQRASSRTAMLWAIALFFLYVGAEINMGAWMYTYAVRAANFTPEVSAYLLTVFWGGFMVGRLLSVFVSTLINPTQYVSGGLLLGAVAAAGMVAFSSQGGPYLWMSVAVLGLSMAAVFPQAIAFVSKTLGLSGRKTAALLIAGSFGGMLMPWLTGLWLDSVSAQALPIAVGLALGLAFISFQMMKRAAR